MTDDGPLTTLDTLRAASAARFDAVGWHYIETLAERTQGLSGAAHALLTRKLQLAQDELHTRMVAASHSARPASPEHSSSPLTALLQVLAVQAHDTDALPGSGVWRAENPRIRQFRKQLRQLSVQKQVTQAIAQGPQNAGPINSHMLVLRSLALIRSISPDYLNRFMVHVDTLLCLEEADKAPWPQKKASPAAKARK